MLGYLVHERLHVRFAVLFGLAALVFVAVWALSYAFLPEGLLRGRTGGAALAGDEAAGSFLAEWLRLVAVNGTLGLVCVVAPNLLWRGYPLGYVTVAVWAAMYAVTLGTNSFAMPLPDGPLVPTLAVLGRSGPYEIAAFALAAASTQPLALWRLSGRWPKQVMEAIPPKARIRLSGERLVGFAAAALVLLAANAWEAYGIVNYAAR